MIQTNEHECVERAEAKKQGKCLEGRTCFQVELRRQERHRLGRRIAVASPEGGDTPLFIVEDWELVMYQAELDKFSVCPHWKRQGVAQWGNGFLHGSGPGGATRPHPPGRQFITQAMAMGKS